VHAVGDRFGRQKLLPGFRRIPISTHDLNQPFGEQGALIRVRLQEIEELAVQRLQLVFARRGNVGVRYILAETLELPNGVAGRRTNT